MSYKPKKQKNALQTRKQKCLTNQNKNEKNKNKKHKKQETNKKKKTGHDHFPGQSLGKKFACTRPAAIPLSNSSGRIHMEKTPGTLEKDRKSVLIEFKLQDYE